LEFEIRNLEPGTWNPELIGWRSPSNIALVKYWGKKPEQIPANPSLSMTLKMACTEMVLEYERTNEEPENEWIGFLFEGKKQDKFEQKIAEYISSLSKEYPILNNYRFKLSSSNTFPHSTGIASSASSMSALGLCLAELIFKENAVPKRQHVFFKEASRLSRLASGSACRSVYGGYVIWGKTPGLNDTSDEYAIPVPFEVNPEMRVMKDAILVVSSTEKEVSSRAGHALMEAHPFAGQRFISAVENILALNRALKSGDFDRFVQITESEALMLHALMMTSNPSYFLFEPNTVNIVNSIRQFRKETSIPVCFTLDAGPNVHLLYPAPFQERIKSWINEHLIQYCENGSWIDDEIGKGPEDLVQSSKFKVQS
jgi:diphosphomevalonate decarboxylase